MNRPWFLLLALPMVIGLASAGIAVSVLVAGIEGSRPNVALELATHETRELRVRQEALHRYAIALMVRLEALERLEPTRCIDVIPYDPDPHSTSTIEPAEHALELQMVELELGEPEAAPRTAPPQPSTDRSGATPRSIQ